jgi:hypothetical protein
MAIDVPLIWPSGKAKYFLFWGLTRFLQIRSDLPVGAVLLIVLAFFLRQHGSCWTVFIQRVNFSSERTHDTD